MITNNVLKFGYGDILVRSDSVKQTISFQQFEPSSICGGPVSENPEFIGEEIIFNISGDDYYLLQNNLRKVRNYAISVFDFKGYRFDFVNLNLGSIDAIKEHLHNAMSLYFMCCAC